MGSGEGERTARGEKQQQQQQLSSQLHRRGSVEPCDEDAARPSADPCGRRKIAGGGNLCPRGAPGGVEPRDPAAPTLMTDSPLPLPDPLPGCGAGPSIGCGGRATDESSGWPSAGACGPGTAGEGADEPPSVESVGRLQRSPLMRQPLILVGRSWSASVYRVPLGGGGPRGALRSPGRCKRRRCNERV